MSFDKFLFYDAAKTPAGSSLLGFLYKALTSMMIIPANEIIDDRIDKLDSRLMCKAAFVIDFVMHCTNIYFIPRKERGGDAYCE